VLLKRIIRYHITPSPQAFEITFVDGFAAGALVGSLLFDLFPDFQARATLLLGGVTQPSENHVRLQKRINKFWNKLQLIAALIYLVLRFSRYAISAWTLTQV
jgi:hypothetical protein